MASLDNAQIRSGTYRSTLGRLALAQKPGRGAPPYSRWVNRRVGRWLAAAAYLARLTPNQVTMLSALTTLAALVLVAAVPPSWWLGPLVAFLLLLAYALDAADGQLARLTGGGSKAGEWLDHVVDAAKIGLMHTAVLVSFSAYSGERELGILLVPVGFMVVSFVFFFGMILTEQLKRAAAAEAGERYVKPSGGGGTLQTLVAIPTDYAVLCLSFVLLGAHELFLLVYLILFVAQGLVLLAVLVRWWLQLRGIDRDGLR